MILGIGSDMVDIRRIEKLLARFGSRFTEKIFSPAEIALAESRGARAEAMYASRFAAREACLKALGTGMREGLSWHDMEIMRDPLGKPSLHLRGAALTRAQALGPAPRCHLSMSEDGSFALAFVVIESCPPPAS